MSKNKDMFGLPISRPKAEKEAPKEEQETEKVGTIPVFGKVADIPKKEE